MGYTARVHGHGLVDWEADQIDAYAAELRSHHQPSRRYLPLRDTPCVGCGLPWPCVAFMWVEQWSARSRKPA